MMFIEPIKPKNFTNFLECIILQFLTRVCESSVFNFCMLPLRICKVKCDWSRRADITEIISGLEFADGIFQQRQALARNMSALAG